MLRETAPLGVVPIEPRQPRPPAQNWMRGLCQICQKCQNAGRHLQTAVLTFLTFLTGGSYASPSLVDRRVDNEILARAARGTQLRLDQPPSIGEHLKRGV
jgi:hypothetical protein